MKKIIIVSKYLFLPIVFFMVEIIFHGNEYVPLAVVIIFSMLLYTYSKDRKIITTLYFFGFFLGVVIEVSLTSLDRVQIWENASVLSVPLWLPFAWGLGSMLFYKLGKDLEK